MEWKKAVNYTIVFLFFVNAVLFGLNMYKKIDVTVGQSRQNGIVALLGKDNITLGCDLPAKYSPMAYIATESFTFDPLKLRDLFFADSSKVMRTDDKNKIIFAYNEDVLTIDKSDVKYVKKSDKPITDMETAKSVANEYVSNINSLFGKYDYACSYATKDGIKLCYYEKVNGYGFFNNYFTVGFNKDGSQEINFSYRTVVKQNGSKKDILASDEAVFAVINPIKDNRKSGKSIIQDVSLGYYDKDILADDDSILPYYKIVADRNTYFVNARTGRVD